jgi:O-antigen/teichoic acid export membrane protein
MKGKIMAKRMSLKKSVIYNSIGTGVYLFCQWLMTFIVVWLSDYENAGILAISMSISTTFSIIATFNMRNYQSSDINNCFSEKTYIFSRIYTSLAAILITYVYCAIKNYTGFQFWCINIYMLYKISEAIVDLFYGTLQKKWRFDIIGKSYFYRGLITILTFSITLLLSKNLLLSLIVMTIGIYLFVIFYDYKNYGFVVKEFGCTNIKNILNLLYKCVPLVIYGISFNYISMYPKVMAEQLLGEKMIGFYSTVATPAIVIQVAATFIYTPLTSLFAEFYDKRDFKNLNINIFKVILLIISFCLIGLIIYFLFSNQIFGLIFGKEILQYTYLFKGVIIISTLTAIIWFIGMVLTVMRSYKPLLFGSIISLIISIFITPIFLNKYSLSGINYVILISYFLQTIIYAVALINIEHKCKI